MFVSLHETGDCRRLADSNVTGHFATESHIFTLDKGFFGCFFFFLVEPQFFAFNATRLPTYTRVVESCAKRDQLSTFHVELDPVLLHNNHVVCSLSFMTGITEKQICREVFSMHV